MQCVWRLSCSACDNLLITILSFFFSLPHPHYPTPFPFNSWFSHLWGNHKELVRSLIFHLLFNGVCNDGQLFFCPFVSTKSLIYSAPPQLTTFYHLICHCNDTAPDPCLRSLIHWWSRCHWRTKVCCPPESPGPHPQRGSLGMPVSGNPDPGHTPTSGIVRGKHCLSITVQNLWNSEFVVLTIFLFYPFPIFRKVNKKVGSHLHNKVLTNGSYN